MMNTCHYCYSSWDICTSALFKNSYTTVVDVLPSPQGLTFDTLARGCEHLIFRAFFFYPHFPKQQIVDLILKRAASPDLQKDGDDGIIRLVESHTVNADDLCHQGWVRGGLMQANSQRLFLFAREPPKIDATQLEIRAQETKGGIPPSY
jgi:hypothetical protein